MDTQIDIFSGFLGAGKTMLIKKLLTEGCYEGKTVLIENEFGEISIDGSSLQDTNVEIQEINSGCICCTVTGDFQRAIEEVMEQYQPHHLIIEPSGVGKLSEVVKGCLGNRYSDDMRIRTLAAVVDVFRFEAYLMNFGEFYRDQLTHARLIVLSRTQLADQALMDQVEGAIRQINPKAQVITSPWDQLDGRDLLHAAKGDAIPQRESKINVQGTRGRVVFQRPGDAKRQRNVHQANEVFDVWSCYVNVSYDQETVCRYFSALAKSSVYGQVLRGKGILSFGKKGWMQFQYVPGELDFQETRALKRGSLCIIGRNLNKEALQKLFLEGEYSP